MHLEREVLSIMLELFEDCSVQVNGDNMELYDESPDSVVDHDLLVSRIKAALKRIGG